MISDKPNLLKKEKGVIYYKTAYHCVTIVIF